MGGSRGVNDWYLDREARGGWSHVDDEQRLEPRRLAGSTHGACGAAWPAFAENARAKVGATSPNRFGIDRVSAELGQLEQTDTFTGQRPAPSFCGRKGRCEVSRRVAQKEGTDSNDSNASQPANRSC